jgi:hypothetical protein
MLHYRALFEELLGGTSTDVAREVPRESEVVSALRRDREAQADARDEDRDRI